MSMDTEKPALTNSPFFRPHTHMGVIRVVSRNLKVRVNGHTYQLPPHRPWSGLAFQMVGVIYPLSGAHRVTVAVEGTRIERDPIESPLTEKF
jgi:hypothetical protein